MSLFQLTGRKTAVILSSLFVKLLYPIPLRTGFIEMEDAVRRILTAIGENPEREGLIDTPKRVRKSFEYLMRG